MGASIGRIRLASSGWKGNPGLNTFYYGVTGPGDPFTETHAGACATVVRDAFNAAEDIYPQGWEGKISPVVDVIDSENGHLINSHVVDPPATLTGTFAGGFGPVAAGLCLNLLTGNFINGRRVRGRVFLSPLVDTKNDLDGTPDSELIGLVQTLGEMLWQNSPEGLYYAVWHRPVNEAGGVAYPVATVTVKDQYSMLTSRRG